MSDSEQTLDIVVVGSCIVEFSMRAPRQPRLGETLTGSGFTVHLGGKGANQAIALARLGANVTFVSRIGDDQYGSEYFDLFDKENINRNFVTSSPKGKTGVCMPLIFPDGANTIVVDRGAAMDLMPACLDDVIPSINSSNALQIHFEIPMETVQLSLETAKKANVPTFVNPAPIAEFDYKLLEFVDVLVPNEIEASFMVKGDIADSTDAFKAARKLRDYGAGTVIITLGKMGAVLSTPNVEELISSFNVASVDSTGAGDAFCAGLLFARLKGSSWHDSVIFANACGAIATTREGGIPSMPNYQEVKNLLLENNLSNCLPHDQEGL